MWTVEEVLRFAPCNLNWTDIKSILITTNFNYDYSNKGLQGQNYKQNN